MRLLPVALALSLASCGGGAPAGLPTELTVVVNAPFSAAPWVADAIERGTRLAAEEINADGGIETAGERYTLAVRTMDTGLSPQRAVENVRTAVADGVLAIVDEGTGVDASWEVARDADLPIGIVFQGGMGLVDHEARPNVFRIAPTDRGIAFRYAEYLVPKGLRIAFLHDDTGYGQEGAAALRRAFECCPEAVEEDLTIPADGDPAPHVLEA
ncbi:MAG TPA: ABC transporter substrate-binding protein, partial [Actinomycetota bacterium]|nr:ABC transporter substrate-binding protein [Actinomycetota bacterium]